MSTDYVVSSAHLAQSRLPESSELEFAMTMSNHAYHRWMVRCMAAAGAPGHSPLEVLVVHQLELEHLGTIPLVEAVVHLELELLHRLINQDLVEME